MRLRHEEDLSGTWGFFSLFAPAFFGSRATSQAPVACNGVQHEPDWTTWSTAPTRYPPHHLCSGFQGFAMNGGKSSWRGPVAQNMHASSFPCPLTNDLTKVNLEGISRKVHAWCLKRMWTVVQDKNCPVDASHFFGRKCSGWIVEQGRHKLKKNSVEAHRKRSHWIIRWLCPLTDDLQACKYPRFDSGRARRSINYVQIFIDACQCILSRG